MNKRVFFNTKNVLYNIWYKDKLKIAIWVLSISAFVVIVGHAYPALFPNPEELIGLAEAMQNPLMVAMFGPVYDPNHYTTAQALGNQMLVFSMLFSAIMSVFIVSRLTRGDEEEGILELMQALPVGRLSNTLATMIIITLMNLALALIIGLGLGFINDESITWLGSMTFGLSIGVTGILMAGVTLIMAQLFENNRLVMSMSFIVLALMYVLRGIGDLMENILIWLIPLNWPARVEVYLNDYNYLNVLTLMLSFGLFGIALVLQSRRDLESGLIPPKKGKETASNILQSPLGFTLRLLRPSLIGWMLTVFILGITYGSVFGDLDTFIEGSDIFDEMLPGGEHPLNVQFMSVIMIFIAITATIGPLMFLTRLIGEEQKNHTEHIYSKAVSRVKMLSIFTGIALLGSLVLLLLGALGMVFGIIASMEEPMEITLILQASLAYLPSLWFMVGLAILIIGFWPSKTSAIWLYLGYAFFSVYMGNIINLPTLFAQLTPFGYIDQLPIEDFSLWPTLGLLFVSLAMGILGFKGYQRRDLLG